MPDASRSTSVDHDDPWASSPDGVAPLETVDPNDVTEERALMLAQHAVYVQGGFSTPEIERDRAQKQLEQSPGSIDWKRMHTEVLEAMAARLTEEVASEEEKQAAAAGLPIAKVRRYKELKEAQAASEAEAKAIKDEANKLEAELIDDFAEAGVQNINVDGKTIYLHRSVFAQRCPGVDAEDVKAALIAAGAGDLITDTINANTLSAWVRELTEDDDAKGLPPEVVGILEPGERYAVRVIAGGTKAKNRTHSKG